MYANQEEHLLVIFMDYTFSSLPSHPGCAERAGERQCIDCQSLVVVLSTMSVPGTQWRSHFNGQVTSVSNLESTTLVPVSYLQIQAKYQGAMTKLIIGIYAKT